MRTAIAVTSVLLLAFLFLFRLNPWGSEEVKSTETLPTAGGLDTVRGAAQAIADEYLDALFRTSWATEFQEWKSSQNFGGMVDTFRTTDVELWEYEKYCYKASDRKETFSAEYFFFDNGNTQTPEPILRQALFFDRRTVPNSALEQKVWEAISTSLTRKFGSPSDIPDEDGLHPFSIALSRSEPKGQLWSDGSRRIALARYFRWEGRVRSDCVALFARESSLDTTLSHLRNCEQIYADSYAEQSPVLASEVCDSIRPTNAPAALKCPYDTSHRVSLNDLLHAAAFVANAERSEDAALLPLYHLALFLASQSYVPIGNGDGTGPFSDVDTLARYGIIFTWSHLGECWGCSAAPLVDLVARYPGSHWGQVAFVILQNAGWCLDGMCNGNHGPMVIAKGREFLRTFPTSPYGAAVRLSIAKGYETNWNISVCQTDAEYMYDENDRSDNESRLEAIAEYERIMEEYSGTREAELARMRLPRLKLGISTGRTDYFFIYD